MNQSTGTFGPNTRPSVEDPAPALALLSTAARCRGDWKSWRTPPREWCCGGCGPAQLALAILLAVTDKATGVSLAGRPGAKNEGAA